LKDGPTDGVMHGSIVDWKDDYATALRFVDRQRQSNERAAAMAEEFDSWRIEGILIEPRHCGFAKSGESCGDGLGLLALTGER